MNFDLTSFDNLIVNSFQVLSDKLPITLLQAPRLVSHGRSMEDEARSTTKSSLEIALTTAMTFSSRDGVSQSSGGDSNRKTLESLYCPSLFSTLIKLRDV